MAALTTKEISLSFSLVLQGNLTHTQINYAFGPAYARIKGFQVMADIFE